jgi:hypothetical protein
MDETGLGLLAIAVAGALIALLIRHLDRRFRARALRAEASVIDYRIETDRQERDGQETFTDLHRPVFRYRDASGIERQALSRVATAPPAYAMGALVPILYDPARPDEAVPETGQVGQRVPLVLGLLAGAVAVFALLRAAILG